MGEVQCWTAQLHLHHKRGCTCVRISFAGAGWVGHQNCSTRGMHQDHNKQSRLIEKCEEIAGIACGIATTQWTPMETECGHSQMHSGLCAQLQCALH